MARPKGITQKRNELKYKLPEGVSLVNPPDKFTKSTKLTFLDVVHGEFISNFYALEDANASTHPEAVKLRRKQTNLSKYGSENASSSSTVKQKRSKTMLERHGVENIMHSTEMKQKIKSNNLTKYGTEWTFSAPEVKEKIKNTLIEVYGVENPMHDERIKKTHQTTIKTLYGVENIMFNPDVKEKHLGAVRSTYEKIGKLNILPNGKNVSQFCKELNLPKNTSTSANKIFNDHGSKIAETWISNWESHRSSLELKFQELFPEAIFLNTKIHPDLPYRPDFKLVHGDKIIYVDIDGLFVHSEARKERMYHFNKREAYEALGFDYFQFYESELNNKPQILKSIVYSKLGKLSKRYYARKLKIKEVSSVDAAKFFSENHIMGEYVSAKHIGLYDNDDLVCCMGYKKHGKGVEISRFASTLFTSIVGGLSKLLKQVLLTTNPEYVLYFVDLRYSKGASVKLLGFEYMSKSLGFRWTDGKNTYHRFTCRANMDSRCLTEKQHADELGLYKIYDAGQGKFLKKV